MRKDREAYNARQKRQRRLRQGLDYDGELAKQSGGCAACQTPPTNRQLHRDHSHRTGYFRGLLCGNCNMALGLLKDDPDRILALYLYLARVGEAEELEFVLSED